jgi:MSHA biogenesis protein MshP
VATPPPLTIAPFSVAVSCVPSVPYTDGADVVVIYQITSTATSGLPGEVDYVERRIQASFSK